MRGLSQLGFLLLAALAGGALSLTLTDRNPGHTPTTLVTALLALAVAAVGGVLADRRQRRQLSHDQQSQERELTAERERLTDRLDHERALKEAETDRQLVEEALGALAQARLEVTRAASMWSPDRDGEGAPDRSLGLQDLRNEMTQLHARLSFRFGMDHDLSTAYLRSMMIVIDTIEVILNPAHRALDAHEREALMSAKTDEIWNALDRCTTIALNISRSPHAT